MNYVRPGRDNPEAELALGELQNLVRPRVLAWERKKKRKELALKYAPAIAYVLMLVGVGIWDALYNGTWRAFGAILGGIVLAFVVIGGIHWWERKR